MLRLGECIYFLVHISGSTEGWVRVSNIFLPQCDSEFKNYRNWWIPAGNLFVNTTDGGYKHKLFREPADTAKVTGYIKEGAITIKSCKDKWVFVEGYTGKARHGAQGWLPYEVQCANPLTNCTQQVPKKYIFSGPGDYD
jgi:hypothetical protein